MMLTPDEQAALEKMKADVKQAPSGPRAPPATVRPERFSDFAPGMGDDGTLNEVDPATGAVKPRKPE